VLVAVPADFGRRRGNSPRLPTCRCSTTPIPLGFEVRVSVENRFPATCSNMYQLSAGTGITFYALMAIVRRASRISCVHRPGIIDLPCSNILQRDLIAWSTLRATSAREKKEVGPLAYILARGRRHLYTINTFLCLRSPECHLSHWLQPWSRRLQGF
jgi:hypothetical protein